MTIEKQLEIIEKNISNIKDEDLLFEMNRKYRELQDQLN